MLPAVSTGSRFTSFGKVVSKKRLATFLTHPTIHAVFVQNPSEAIVTAQHAGLGRAKTVPRRSSAPHQPNCNFRAGRHARDWL